MPAAARPLPRSRRLAFADLAPVMVSMTSLCLGSSFAKSLFVQVGAGGMTGLRNGLSAAIMLAVFRPWRWSLDAGQWRLAVAYGVVLGVMNLSFYLALARLPVGIAIAVEFLGPLAVALCASARALDLVWIALAAGGVGLLAWPDHAPGGAIDPVGIGFVLVAAACWAAYILIGRRAAAAMTGAQAVAIGLATAATVTVPVAAYSAGAALLRPHVLAAGLVVALLCSALPYPLELIAMRRLPARVFGVVLSLEPAIGALAGLVVLGEHLSPLRWGAILAVVAASAGVTLTHGAPAGPDVPPPQP